VTSAGTQLVEEFLSDFAQSSAHLWKKTTDGEDIVMDDGDEDAAQRSMEDQVKILQECYERFKPRLEESEWSRQVLAQTY
jgi:hypothetical protein